MSASEKNYNDGTIAPAFSSHNEQTHSHYTQPSSPTFRPNEHEQMTTLTALPPFSSMMQAPFPTSSEPKYPYDKDMAFTESRPEIPSQSQSYAPSLEDMSTNLSESQFYRSAIRSADLPNPLPVPPYSQELLNARELGRTVEYRSMVIRETVKYFLKMKYWWTSEDYDAMAQMVAREFPDLRDTNVAPGQPDYVRIRAHLSQTARNLRRVAKNQQHRKLSGKTDATATTTTSHSSADIEQETVPSSVVHNLKQDLSSNRMALPSVAHILSKQYLSPSPMSYPMSSASLLPQMMSASSILASPAYQKYLHSSLLQMSPEGMSSLSQKLLSQLATGSYASLPAFGHSPGFPYPVKVEPESVLKNQCGPLSSYPSTRTDDQSDEVHQQHLQGRESLSPVSSVGSAKDRDYQDGEDLPVHFGTENSLMPKGSESQRDVSPITHHVGNFSPAASHTHSIAKDARKRARSNSECEDDIKSPHLGLSDEAQLPNPLPVPRYSERVLSANEMGMTKDMRSTIIRETTIFFLNIKYRWTSSDYDRISSMVVSLFPALRDPITSPGYAPTRRVRSDLSMCARNIRRRDVNKITTGYARKKSRAATCSFVYDPKSSVNVKTEPVYSQYSDLSQKAWEQGAQVHELHGQTLENTPVMDSGYELTAREIARQNLMMMANSADHIQTSMYRQQEESGAGSIELNTGKASEAGDVGETGQDASGHKDLTDSSVPIDATVPHRSYFTNEDPRNDNVKSDKGAYGLDHDQSSYKEVSQEPEDVSMKKQNKQIETETNHNQVTDTCKPVENIRNVSHSAFGCEPSQGHTNNVDSSYTGFARNIPINLSSTSDTVNCSSGRNATVDGSSHANYGCPNIDSSCGSSVSSASYFSNVINNSANNHNLETGYYMNHESVMSKSASEDQTRHSDQSKSSANSSVDVQDDSNCALTFTPLNVEDLHTNSHTEGHKSSNISGLNPANTCSTQISDAQEQTLGSLSKKMAANEYYEKAIGFMADINSGHPYQQRDLGPSESTASSKTCQPATGSTLPDPLPVPAYSSDVLKHQQLGQILEVKQQVVKETVSFYLQWKSSKWTSAEYARVVRLILQQFPELRAVKMLKSMVFFAVRNISSRRNFFQSGRFWSKKNKRLQTRPKIATNPNQNGGSRAKCNSGEMDTTPDNLMHHGNPDITKSFEMETLSEPSSNTNDPARKTGPDKLRSSLTRQISLPNPLPVPEYSEQLQNPELDYTLKHHRLQIIRETVKYFLLIKYWWSSRDYERIAEMVVTQFPRLADQDTQAGGPVYKKVRRELSMCARNLRRRFVWWDKQSNQTQSDPHQEDVKDPNIVHKLKMEFVFDQDREIPSTDAAADSKGRGITHMDSTADTGLKPAGYAPTSTESAAYGNHCGESTKQSSGHKHRQPEACGYRNNVGKRLSALDHHGHFSGAVPTSPNLLQNAVKMKKTYVNPDHGNQLQTQLSQLWKEGKYFDANLEVNGTKIPTHKLILLAMCPFLQSTLDHMDTKHRIEISMPENSTIEAVDAFLKYLYDGVIHINTDTVHALCKIADMMHIHRLYKHCQDFIESWKKEQQLQEDELNVYRLSLKGQDSECSQSLNNYHQPGTVDSTKSERAPGQELQHGSQDGTKFSNSSPAKYPAASAAIVTAGDSSQTLNHNYQVTNFSGGKFERSPSLPHDGSDITSRQQYLYHQSGQSVDNLYDKSKVQRSTGDGSSPATSVASQRELLHRDTSLKVDRRVSEKIADTYSRWTSGSGHFELQSEQMVKQEKSGTSSSVALQNSSAHYKQDRSESSNSIVPLNNSSVHHKQEMQESSSSSVPLQNSSAHKHEVDSVLQQSVFPQWWSTKM